MTAEELLRLPMGLGARHELVKGVLQTRPLAGFAEGNLTAEIGTRLWNYVQPKKLGRILAAGTGFQLAHNPDTVRAPDVSFVQQARAVQVGKIMGYFPGAPDLAVEVVSGFTCVVQELFEGFEDNE